MTTLPGAKDSATNGRCSTQLFGLYFVAFPSIIGRPGPCIVSLQGICSCIDAFWGFHLKPETGSSAASRICSEAIHSTGWTWWCSRGSSEQETGANPPWTDPGSQKLRLSIIHFCARSNVSSPLLISIKIPFFSCFDKFLVNVNAKDRHHYTISTFIILLKNCLFFERLITRNEERLAGKWDFDQSLEFLSCWHSHSIFFLDI